jgi:hypothetical protein
MTFTIREIVVQTNPVTFVQFALATIDVEEAVPERLLFD